LTGYDFVTIKYDSQGELLWIQRYNGLGIDYDESFAISVDASGNVYVAGRSIGVRQTIMQL
jgi:hypothetical protein